MIHTRCQCLNIYGESTLDWGGEDERTEEADKVQRFAFSLRVDSFNKCLGLINERKIAFTKHIQATTNIN